MKVFVICPIRNVDQTVVKDYVRGLEVLGYEVYYPARDTNQNDPSGLQICKDNFKALRDSDEVHIIWDGKSEGVLFDCGMTFALSCLGFRKKIVPLDLPKLTDGKSFQNMIVAWSREDT